MDLDELAEKARSGAEYYVDFIAKNYGVELDFGAWSVGWVDDHINEQRTSWFEAMQPAEIEQIVEYIGAFLGECIRERLDGTWVMFGEPAVQFAGAEAGDTQFALPFARVAKQIHEGEEHAIYEFFLRMAEAAGRIEIDEDGAIQMPQSVAEALGFRPLDED